jgi:hypothetical protein
MAASTNAVTRALNAIGFGQDPALRALSGIGGGTDPAQRSLSAMGGFTDPAQRSLSAMGGFSDPGARSLGSLGGISGGLDPGARSLQSIASGMYLTNTGLDALGIGFGPPMTGSAASGDPRNLSPYNAPPANPNAAPQHPMLRQPGQGAPPASDPRQGGGGGQRYVSPEEYIYWQNRGIDPYAQPQQQRPAPQYRKTKPGGKQV